MARTTMSFPGAVDPEAVKTALPPSPPLPPDATPIFSPESDQPSSSIRPRAWRTTSEELDVEDTFKQEISVTIAEPVGSMSISPAQRDVCLAARKGIFIIDLENPYSKPRFLPQGGLRPVADVQWSPHAGKAAWLASTMGEKLMIWNLDHRGGIALDINAHMRAITDINWGVFHEEILATASLDCWVKVWDLRDTRRDVQRFAAWGYGTGATQVKWNRKKDHILATSHDSKILVWDDRMGSIPILSYSAHDAKIYGIDWSRSKTDEMATCSLDGSMKTWKLRGLGGESDQDDSIVEFHNDTQVKPVRTINTRSPVWRARILPFGDGLLSLPQRGDTSLKLWALPNGQPEVVVREFQGHTDKVKEFVWRSRGGDDLNYDDRRFQLITWSKDQTLRLWPLDVSTMKLAGHVPGSKIEVVMTRKGAQDHTYAVEQPSPEERDEPAASSSSQISLPLQPVPVATVTAPLGNLFGGVKAQPQNYQPPISRLQQKTGHSHSFSSNQESRLSFKLKQTSGREHSQDRDSANGTKTPTAAPSKAQKPSAASIAPQKTIMTRGRAGPRARMGVSGTSTDLIWAQNVKVHRQDRDGLIRSGPNSAESSRRQSRTNSITISRSRDRSGSLASGGVRQGSAHSRSLSVSRGMASSSLANSRNWNVIADDDEEERSSRADQVMNFQEEVTRLQRIWGTRCRFEETELGTRRFVTINPSGPWAAGQVRTTVRVRITVPSSYPFDPSSAASPTVKLLDNSKKIPLDTRQFIFRTLKRIADEERPCLEYMVKFLVGRGYQGIGRAGIKETLEAEGESESSEDEVSSPLTQLKRPCGASFGPNGELLIFTNLRQALKTTTSGKLESNKPTPLAESMMHGNLVNSSAFLVEDPATKAINELRMLDKTIINGRSSFDSGVHLARISALARDASERRSENTRSGGERSSSIMRKPVPAASIYNITHLIPQSKHLGSEYLLLDPSSSRERASAGVIDVCKSNFQIAEKYERTDHKNIWDILEFTLRGLNTENPSPATSTLPRFKTLRSTRGEPYSWGTHPMAMFALSKFLELFLKKHDVQMVASISSILPHQSSSNPPINGSPLSGPVTPIQVLISSSPSPIGADYFSLPTKKPHTLTLNRGGTTTPNRDLSPSSPSTSPFPGSGKGSGGGWSANLSGLSSFPGISGFSNILSSQSSAMSSSAGGVSMRGRHDSVDSMTTPLINNAQTAGGSVPSSLAMSHHMHEAAVPIPSRSPLPMSPGGIHGTSAVASMGGQQIRGRQHSSARFATATTPGGDLSSLGMGFSASDVGSNASSSAAPPGRITKGVSFNVQAPTTSSGLSGRAGKKLSLNSLVSGKERVLKKKQVSTELYEGFWNDDEDCGGPISTSIFPQDLRSSVADAVRVYADQLNRWNLPLKRTELLNGWEDGKLGVKTDEFAFDQRSRSLPTNDVHKVTASITGFEAKHYRSKRVTGEDSSSTSKQRPVHTRAMYPQCVVCHRVIKGRSTNCVLCEHASHTNCFENFFEGSCPSGCDCDCVAQAAFWSSSANEEEEDLPQIITLKAAYVE